MTLHIQLIVMQRINGFIVSHEETVYLGYLLQIVTGEKYCTLMHNKTLYKGRSGLW